MGEPRTKADGSAAAPRSGSSTAPQAAARNRTEERSDTARIEGPGEERYLTRAWVQYAPGSAGQGVGPQGRKTGPACLAASGGFGAQPQGFQVARTASNNLIHGNKVPHPCGTRLSEAFG